MSNDGEQRFHLLVAHRYVLQHPEGLFALLLFFIALLLGAAVAMGLHALVAPH